MMILLLVIRCVSQTTTLADHGKNALSVFYQITHLSLAIPVLSLAIPGLSLAIPC